LRLRFTHGLGDVVHACHALQLYIRRGYSVTIQAEPNKLWVWGAAGITTVTEGDFPDHRYEYPPRFWDAAAPDHEASKIAHFFEHPALPRLGDKDAVWRELCDVRLDVRPHVRPDYAPWIESFLAGLPRPIVLLHSKGTTFRDQKSLPDGLVVELIVELLQRRAFGGSIVTLDFDSRAATVGHTRVRPVVPHWPAVDTERICALFDAADLLIGVDSGPLHLAAMTSIPTLGVFRDIPPNHCCLPNPNTTYLARDCHSTAWRARRDSWRIATYAGQEPAATHIADEALRILAARAKPPRDIADEVCVNLDVGPFFNGIGDAIVLAWAANGARFAGQRVTLYSSNASHRQCLEALGQDLASTAVGVSPSPIYERERAEAGRRNRAVLAMEVLGMRGQPRRPEVVVSARATEFAAHFWGDAPLGRRVLLCPETNDRTRAWGGWESLAARLAGAGCVTRRLTKHDCASNWHNVAAITRMATVVVACDSAHAHMAATVGAATLVLLGPTRPGAYAHANNVQSIQLADEISCVGCCYGHPLNVERDCYGSGCRGLVELDASAVGDAVLGRIATQRPMFYRTYSQLASDVRSWSRSLPEFVAVAGVPRAGVIVAGMLAAERNIHLVTLDDLVAGRAPWREPLRRNCPAKADGDVLVVDDTVASGARAKELRSLLPHDWIKLGAVYGKDQGAVLVDHVHKRVGTLDHIFEWNWQHHWFVEEMLFDLDGVLCEEWPHTREDGELHSAYLRHVADANLLMRPSFPIMEIVTARLEKHREETERWLHRHGIRFRALTMAPFDTPQERAANLGFAERKAQVYRDRPGARMFVESSHHQAEIIARLTGRPVLSWERQVLLNGTEP